MSSPGDAAESKDGRKDLKEFFSVVGDVRSVKMIQDRHSRRSKAIGIAYIEFKYSQSVPLALGLSGQPVNGIPILVQQSQAEKNRHAAMVESAKQTLSKLGNGPIKLKVRVGKRGLLALSFLDMINNSILRLRI